jgi:hypothetical protein
MICHMNQFLTQHDLQSIVNYDPLTGVFTNKIDRNPRAPKGAIAGYTNTIGYTVIQINGRKLHAHRLVWLYMTGEWPLHEIDHINRVRSDNRFENLRQATSAENKHNATDRISNTSGCRGVTWHKARQKWQAQISVMGKYLYLGTFESVEDAVAARKDAVVKFHKFAQGL